MLKENYKKNCEDILYTQIQLRIWKIPFPSKFRIKNKNKIYELIGIERPSCKYIILEFLLHIKENNENNKFIHVINIKSEAGVMRLI